MTIVSYLLLSPLCVFAGNEVTLYARERQIELNAPCQKKFLRDMRDYVNTCHQLPASILPRKIPIGMVNWDVERTLQSLYFNCLTDTSDLLENAEWYGLNAYQHCDAQATTVNDLRGWIQMRQDFIDYNLPVPVVIGEYGCRESGFPTAGEFDAQRNWLQVDALYSEEYQQVFAGGVVFEYSAEKLVVDRSSQGNPWPYYGFMKLQYGVGYYSPVDCDHATIPCEYNPYPEFDWLKDKLAAVDASFMPNINDYNPTGAIPQCPQGLPALSLYVWPTDDEPDLPCYIVETEAPTMAPSSAPSSAPTISVAPSLAPSTAPTSSPTTVEEAAQAASISSSSYVPSWLFPSWCCALMLIATLGVA